MAKRSGLIGCVMSLLVGCGEVKGSLPDAGAALDAAPDIDAPVDAPVDAPEARVTIGGVASYLPTGGGSLLSLELLDTMGVVVGMPLMVMADGPFTFGTDLPATGAGYSVRIASTPTGATCWVQDRAGAGMVGITAGANVTSLVVRCVKATSVRTTATTSITSTAFPATQSNPVLPVVPLTLPAAADVLVTLTVPYTSGIDASVWDMATLWAGVRDGVAPPALLGSRRQVAFEMGGPLQLTGVLRLPAGVHNLEAVFRSDVGPGVDISAPTQMTVVVLDSLSTYVRHVGNQAPSLYSLLTSATGLQQVAAVAATLPAAAPALVYAHVPRSYGTNAANNTRTSGDFVLGDGPATIAIAGHDVGEADTAVSTTLLGGRMLTAGTHAFHLDGVCANPVGSCQLAIGGADLNLGMIEFTPAARLNVAATTATAGQFTTDSNAYTPIDNDGGANELSTTITLAAPRQVLVMLSTQRVLTTQNGNASQVRLFMDGAALDQGPIFISPNGDRGVSLPSYALVNLTAGTHAFDARWAHSNQDGRAVAASLPKAGNVLSLLVLE